MQFILSSFFDARGQTQQSTSTGRLALLCVLMLPVYLSRVVGCDEEYMSTTCVYFSLPHVRQWDEVIILNFVFSLLVFEFAKPAGIIG